VDWHDLHKKKVTELREIASGYDDVGAVSGMDKETLVELVAKHMGIPKPHRVVVGIDKAGIKSEIREWKVKRAAALESGDSQAATIARKQIRKRKRKLRHAARLTH